MKYSNFNLNPKSPGSDEGKMNRLLEGETHSFPGNASITEFFQAGLVEGKILPEHRALVEVEKHHTFKELNDISNQIALAIRNLIEGSEKGLTPNSDKDIIIGVCLPPSERLIFSLFAILKLGAAYLPFDNSFPEERVGKIVEGARPILIISDGHKHTLSKFDLVARNTPVITFEDLMALAQKETIPEGEVDPFEGDELAERTAIVMYTSGSSGEPKGVRLSNRTVMNRLSWQWATFPYIEHERCCFKTSLTFVDSVSEIFGPLLTGHSVTIFGKNVTSQPNLLLQRISDDKITRIVLVPSLLRAIIDTITVLGGTKAQHLAGSIRLWVCSGETLPKDLLLEFFEKFKEGTVLCNFYGSTEIMGDVTYETFTSLKDVEEKSETVHIPIGRAIFNTIIYILDANLTMVPEGECGEIFIAGYNLATGYVGTADSPKFIANPFSNTEGFNRLFRTGDFGKILKLKNGERTLLFEGRIDSQIKIRGMRVDLGEIEATMHSNPDVVDKVVVLCYHPGEQDQTIVAFVLPKPGVKQARIEMLMRLKLRDYEMPELRILTEIPHLVNGKIDRQRLLASYEAERTHTTPYDKWHLLKVPEEQLDALKALVDVMSSVTGTSQLEIVHDLEDSFFNLGGTSLNAITVIMKLREKNFNIPIPEFINAKSIFDIVANLQEVSPDDNVSLSPVGENVKILYDREMLKLDYYDEVVEIIAYSFSHRGDLEVYTHAQHADFVKLVHSLWSQIVTRNCSFLIRRKDTDKVVAVALNFDAYDEPELTEVAPGIRYVLDFLEFIESKQRDKLPKGPRKLWHSFMMGTHEEVDDSENVLLTIFMEEENIQLAKQRKYEGILTTNTSPLTMQICEKLHGYQVLTEYQVNLYETPDGAKPFVLAPDSQKVVCCWKKIEHSTKGHPA